MMSTWLAWKNKKQKQLLVEKQTVWFDCQKNPLYFFFFITNFPSAVQHCASVKLAEGFFYSPTARQLLAEGVRRLQLAKAELGAELLAMRGGLQGPKTHSLSA